MQDLEAGTPLDDPLAPYLAVDRSRPAGPCWVLAHMVGSLDGSATAGGRVQTLSTPADTALFTAMRTLADVVMVGAGTVRAEGYTELRLPPERVAARRAAGRSDVPAIAVVSRSLDLDWSARAFTDPPAGSRSVVVTCASADADRVRRARELADVVVAGDQRVDPVAAMAALASAGHRVVLCEGGPSWLGQVAAADCLDELCLTISPRLGGDALPVSVTPPGAPLRQFALRHVLRAGDTLFLRYERPAGGR